MSLCCRRSVSLLYGGILEDLWPSLFGKQHQHNHVNIEKARYKEMKQRSGHIKEMYWAIV